MIIPTRFLSSPRPRLGFTLVELLVVIAIIGTLVGLLLPAVQAARAAAQRSACTNKIKQLALASLNYENTNKSLPASAGGTCCWANGGPSSANNAARRSAFVELLPFIEEVNMYNQIQAGGGGIAAGGPYAWISWSVWNTAPRALSCPVDTENDSRISSNSYALSVGDQVSNLRTQDNFGRGAFTRTAYRGTTPITPRGTTIADIVDGTSKTILMSERIRGNGTSFRTTDTVPIRVGVAHLGSVRLTPNACLTLAAGQFYVAGTNIKQYWGDKWTDGQVGRVGFNTVLPPNSPSCGAGQGTGGAPINNADDDHAVQPPSSYHPGGVSVAFCDASVRFIADNIDTGNTGTVVAYKDKTPSPFGVWGALGSKAGAENTANE